MLRKYSLTPFILLLLLAIPFRLFAIDQLVSDILIINSYNAEYRWTEDQYTGITDALKNIGHEYEVYTEYLDWKRFPNETHIDQIYEMCTYKYQHKKIDLIITTDDRALQFAVENRVALFSDAPIVFSGVFRGAATALLSGETRVTGVYEELDVANTIRHAHRLQPELEHVYLLNELTESGRATERIMQSGISALKSNFSTASLSGMPLGEIETFLKTVSKHSIVLIGAYFIDINGQSFATEILAQRISKVSVVPVYTVYSHVFGTGVLGGSMLNGMTMGRSAGELALRILSGESPDSIVPTGANGFVTVFDAAVVKKFDLPFSALPSGALLINQNPPFFEQYRFESLAVLALFILLCIFVAILSVLYRKMKHIAFFDQLTGLQNKTMAFSSGDRVLAQNEKSRTAALLCIDIDRFKYMNDTFGHAFGDRILVRISEILRGQIGRDVRVTHFGGNEFLVLVLNSSHREIIEYTERLLALLGSKMSIEGRDIFLGFNVGVALYPAHALKYTDLLQNANTAMHQAKNSAGTKYVFYDEVMYHALMRRMEIENGLRSALANGEMHVVYQPQIDLVTGRLVGLEALLRWKHSSQGSISPSEFIPVAESSGQIEPIGLFVFAETVRFMKEADAAGRSDFSVSVNVSVKQMHKPEFIDLFVEILGRECVSANRLTIEITESVLMEDINEIRHTLDRLREIGFKIALDDFGTGYSSLTYLRNLPVNYLKMDKSFIDGMFADERTMLLTGSIIRICHDLGMIIVAEGVEDAEQCEFLRDQTCDLIQGYYFSKPIPEIDALALLDRIFCEPQPRLAT